MSLVGVRDISNLESPPEDRVAVETRVTRWDKELIKHAINRELARDGQIYFVHNRVNDIELLANKLRMTTGVRTTCRTSAATTVSSASG